MWCIPADANAEFVWRMEDVLEVYERPYDPLYPLVCMDETSKRLVAQTRLPRPARPGRVAQEDCEYERKGTCNLFMFFEPLRGRRRVWVTQRRRKVEWACRVRELLRTHYPSAKKVLLVCDNLNTHTGGALYEAFPATESSVLAGQCLDRRMDSAEFVASEVAAWEEERNRLEAKVRWQFRTEGARIKLERLYPEFDVDE